MAFGEKCERVNLRSFQGVKETGGIKPVSDGNARRGVKVEVDLARIIHAGWIYSLIIEGTERHQEAAMSLRARLAASRRLSRTKISSGVRLPKSPSRRVVVCSIWFRDSR